MENRKYNRKITSFWDRIELLPTIVNCIDNINVDYRLPYHPSVIIDPRQNQILLDLYFFYLRRLSNENTVQISLVKQVIMTSNLPTGTDRKHDALAHQFFKQIKDYFIIQLTATVLCHISTDTDDKALIDEIFKNVIKEYLQVGFQATQLPPNVKLFFSVIITNKNWMFLQSLLQSKKMKKLDAKWTETMTNLLALDQAIEASKSLRLCHQVQFTIHTNDHLSIFPKLHQPYQSLNQCVHRCSQNTDPNQRWNPLIDWIQKALNSRPSYATAIEIKVMLLLNIYYNYYCNNLLKSLDGLSSLIKNHLQPNDEELIVFNAFLNPIKYMIGYNIAAGDPNENYLNTLFHLDFKDHEDLAVRHVLVNLLAMILLAGKESFLWVFAFDPLALTNNFGFGSLRREPVSTRVHYDCGCMLSETGSIVIPPNGRSGGSYLDIPAIYVAYFATFGALAWHLLLYKKSVDNLYHPILAKHAIDNKAHGHRISNAGLLGRVSSFVYTRIGPTKFFLEQKFGSDETCLLLTRCFEQFASLSRQPRDNKWIKPLFKLSDEQYQAEKGFQDHVFYQMSQKLAEHAKFISSLNAKSDIQKDLQDYIAYSSIIVKFEHFQTELCNPYYDDLPLKTLRHLLDSFDYLQITKYIYNLSQFHQLLHRTFSYLIETDEFLMISLEQLYTRSRKHFARLQQESQSLKHWTIIQDGIEAVNAYHQFSGGQIRPGACEITQTFEPISIDTPVSYLVESNNSEEGDIVRRILSVLVEFHNHVLSILEQQIHHNHDVNVSPLTKLIRASSNKEISIIQIAQGKTGIITIDEHDRQWIEQLCRACLQNQNTYFLRRDSPLTFDYPYIQSYIIRTYLLYCRVNVEHIRGQYRCLNKRKKPMLTTSKSVHIDQSLEEEWSHLKHMSIAHLEKELKFLERIQEAFNNINDGQISKMRLSEFVKATTHGGRFAGEYDQYEIEDFLLQHISIVCELYTKAINASQHMFEGVSQDIMETLDLQLNQQFDSNLEEFIRKSLEKKNKVMLDKSIEMISEFIKDLQENSQTFAGRLSESFRETCEALAFSEECYQLIPNEVRGKNYRHVCQKFIDRQSQLYEEKMSIRDKILVLWNPFSDRFTGNLPEQNDFADLRQTSEGEIPDDEAQSKEPEPENNRKTVGQYEVNTIQLPPTSLFKITQKKMEERRGALEKRCTLTLIDKTIEKKLILPAKLYEKFRETFKSKNYDANHLTIVDSDGLNVDFLDLDVAPLIKPTKNEYYVIEKSELHTVHLEFKETGIDYLVIREAQLSSIVSHFIVLMDDIEKQETMGDFHLFDQSERLLADDCSLKDLNSLNRDAQINLVMVPFGKDHKSPVEVVFTPLSGDLIRQIFSPTILWAQVNTWSQDVLSNSGESTSNLVLWSEEKQNFIDDNESVESILADPTLSAIVNIIRGEALINVSLSYREHSKTFRLMKSTTLAELLKNPEVLNEFHWTISPENCIFSFGEREKERLQGNDLKQTLKHYASRIQGILSFKISTFVRIIDYNGSVGASSETLVELSHRNHTIGELLEMLGYQDDHYYLASKKTKVVFNEELSLNDLTDTEFYRVKESQICLLSIESDDTMMIRKNEMTNQQRFMIDATLDDVCKQNSIIENDRFIQCEKDYVPPYDTALSVLIEDPQTPLKLNRTSMRQFVPITIRLIEEEKLPIKLYCLPSISLKRLTEIMCSLWRLNSKYYRLQAMNGDLFEEDKILLDIPSSMNNQQLLLISKADIRCIVKYESQTVNVATMKDAVLSSIVEEALKKLRIFNEDVFQWKLYLLDDLESPTEVDLDFSIKDLSEDQSENGTTISLQLERV